MESALKTASTYLGIVAVISPIAFFLMGFILNSELAVPERKLRYSLFPMLIRSRQLSSPQGRALLVAYRLLLMIWVGLFAVTLFATIRD